MSKAKSEVKNPNIPEGFESQKAGEFFTFKNVGEVFHGVFQGKKEVKSAVYGNIQICWKAIDVKTGELFLIGEKTSMKDMMIQEGQEFYLEYSGDVVSKNNTEYKTFNLYTEKLPF